MTPARPVVLGPSGTPKGARSFAYVACNILSEQKGKEVSGHVEREENMATPPCG